MNSWSKNNYEPCRKEERYEERYEHCKKEEIKKCETFVKCGCPSSTALPVVAVGLPTQEVALSSLTLDTSCICNPRIKIDFTTNLVVPIAALLLGGINIQVFKQCKNQLTRVPVGPSFTVGPLIVVGSQTVSFFVCDSDTCSDNCCTYTAVASIPALAVVLVGGSLNNSTLAATVTCGDSGCNRSCNY